MVMNEVQSSAAKLVSSVLTEAYPGAVGAILAKYHLLDAATGDMRLVQLDRKKPDGTLEKEPVPGPMIAPDVINRLLALDKSSAKRGFDWILFATGGGEPHLRESEKAMELVKDWVIVRRMRGVSRDESAIKPMTRGEAEQDWMANDYQIYHDAYFYGDQDVAGDRDHPVFGWFRNWPGRHNVYQKVEEAVIKFNALHANLLKDKKFVANWNKLRPNSKLMADVAARFWTPDGKPRYADVDALDKFQAMVKATMARDKAEANIVTVGRNAPEAGGGYHTGKDAVFYEDEHLIMYVPMTGAASLKRGFNDWCVANNSRWEGYFTSQSTSNFMWGGEFYTGAGPFGFITFKAPLGDDKFVQLTGRPQSWKVNMPRPEDNTKRPPLAMLAAHAQLSANPNTPGRFNMWDMENRQRLSVQEIERRIRATVPAALPSFKKALSEMEAWLTQFKREQLERYPSLESLMAKALVNTLLA